MSLGFASLLLAGLIIALGSCLQGSTGVGLALVAAPSLALIDTRLVPVPITIVGLALLILMSIRERRALNLAGVGWSVAGSLPGAVVGAFVVAQLSGAGIATMCGILILLAVVMSVSGWTPPFTRSTLLQAGLASGFMGTSTSSAGPPMALVYQHRQGAEVRATLSTFFIVGNLFALASLTLFGQVGYYQLKAAAWLLPFTVVGFLASGPARSILDRGYIRPVILSISAISATLLLGQALL